MEKEENEINIFWNVLKEEWIYLGNRRKIFILYLFLFIIAGAIALTVPLIIGLIFNTIQENITSDADLKKLLFMIFLLLVVDVVFWIFHGTGRILEQKTGFIVHKNFVNTKIRRVLELPTLWHKDHHSGDTIDKINRADGSLTEFSQHITFGIVYAILNIFGSLIILFFVDPIIAGFALIFSMLILFIIMKIDKKLMGYYRELNKYSNKLSSVIFDYISNIFTVITLKLKKNVSEEINERIMVSYETEKKAILLNEFKWSFGTIALSLMVVLALSYKAYTEYNSTGIILIGTLYILYSYLDKVGDTFFRFAQIYGGIARTSSRISGVKLIDDEFKKVKEEIKMNLPYEWNEIELKNVEFSYENKGKKKNLKDINLKIKRGQKIAFIGESGSGKSTILAILRGLYPVDKGYVYCDGKKLDHGFTRLKHHVTLIPQDPEIFNNTIGYNITMGLRTNKNEIEKAINMAQFGKVVERLEKGLKTNVLEKGVSLSGGEKQRLALARGLLAAKKSDIVLMDEPTSSVDSVNELKIHENLFSEFKDKIIISSIHRLHLLKNFDYIYMFDNGKIVGEGTINEIKKHTKFMSIWRKYMLEKEKDKR
jgi:ABC-type multidrug transport system fused ATPase/permease subunit|tara:strand:- start:60 stop:1850 length:1791 start_codon:yes stop_codon:yes gene_type:complete